MHFYFATDIALGQWHDSLMDMDKMSVMAMNVKLRKVAA